MNDALARLIDALARRAVEEYLTPKPASDQTDSERRTNPVPLSDVDEAA